MFTVLRRVHARLFVVLGDVLARTHALKRLRFVCIHKKSSSVTQFDKIMRQQSTPSQCIESWHCFINHMPANFDSFRHSNLRTHISTHTSHHHFGMHRVKLHICYTLD